jgi:hypothetical protein
VTAQPPATPDPTIDPRVSPAGPANPFETLVLAACATSGWAVLSHTAQPTSLQALLPPWLRVVWGALLLVGGVLTVVGLYWRDHFTGIEIKRVGLIAAAAATLAYGTALLTIGPPGFVAAAGNLATGLACIVRVWQVTHALKAARGRMRDMRAPRRGRDGGEPG